MTRNNNSRREGPPKGRKQEPLPIEQPLGFEWDFGVETSPRPGDIEKEPNIDEGSIIPERYNAKDKFIEEDGNKSFGEHPDTVAFYYVNLPLQNMAFESRALARKIMKRALAFDRTKNGLRSFFYDEYPDVVNTITFESDATDSSLGGSEESPFSWTRENCIRYYKVLSQRVAERTIQYKYHKMFQAASLFNLCFISNIRGSGNVNAAGGDLRSAYFDRFCQSYSDSPTIKDLEKWALSVLVPAEGLDNRNRQILAMPLIITDIWGNRLIHSFSLDSLATNAAISTNGEDKKFVFVKSDDTQTVTPYPAIQSALHNLEDVAFKWGYKGTVDSPLGNGYWPYNNAKPHMPFCENSAEIFVRKGSTSARASLASDGFVIEDINQDIYFGNITMPKLETQLGHLLWNNFAIWTEVLTDHFHDFFSSANQWRQLLAGDKDAGWDPLFEFGNPTKPSDLKRSFCPSAAHSINDLMKAMQYSAGHATNTATVVKWAPLIHDNNGKVNSKTNFQRWDATLEDPEQFLSDIKQWPSLSPTTFWASGREDDYIVINSIPQLGRYKSDVKSQAVMSGRLASIFDKLKHDPTEHLNIHLTFTGLSKQDAKDLVSEDDDNAIAVLENNAGTFTQYQPLIDTTDLGQCGFYACLGMDLNFGTKDQVKSNSVWDVFFANADNYFKDASATGTPKEVVLANDFPTAPVFGNKTEDKHRRHWVNPDYRAAKHSAFVFLGLNIMFDPWDAIFLKTCGYFYQQLSDGNNTNLKSWISLPTASGLTQPAVDITSSMMYASADRTGAEARIDTSYDAVTKITAGNDYDVTTYLISPAYGPISPIFALPNELFIDPIEPRIEMQSAKDWIKSHVPAPVTQLKRSYPNYDLTSYGSAQNAELQLEFFTALVKRDVMFKLNGNLSTIEYAPSGTDSHYQVRNNKGVLISLGSDTAKMFLMRCSPTLIRSYGATKSIWFVDLQDDEWSRQADKVQSVLAIPLQENKTMLEGAVLQSVAVETPVSDVVTHRYNDPSRFGNSRSNRWHYGSAKDNKTRTRKVYKKKNRSPVEKFDGSKGSSEVDPLSFVPSKYTESPRSQKEESLEKPDFPGDPTSDRQDSQANKKIQNADVVSDRA